MLARALHGRAGHTGRGRGKRRAIGKAGGRTAGRPPGGLARRRNGGPAGPGRTGSKFKEDLRMKFTRLFTRNDRDPFDAFMYETRTSVIRNGDGSEASREMRVEVPCGWSQTATDILAQKYLCRRNVPLRDEAGRPLVDAQGNPCLGSETSVKQVVDRLAGCWRHWGESLGYFDSPEDATIFYDEAVHMLLDQMAAPNSPQWFNTGLHWKYGITGD